MVKADGRSWRPGEEGEVRAKAPQVMVGYVGSSLDADAFDDGGWFRTGDLGGLDERHLVITGRLKDIIIRGVRTSRPRRWRTWCTNTRRWPTWR